MFVRQLYKQGGDNAQFLSGISSAVVRERRPTANFRVRASGITAELFNINNELRDAGNYLPHFIMRFTNYRPPPTI